jgi:hypothetical protein
MSSNTPTGFSGEELDDMMELVTTNNEADRRNFRAFVILAATLLVALFIVGFLFGILVGLVFG